MHPVLPSEVDAELERQAAEGFLVNGSVNNAAASPFAQSRAFGNNRPGQRSLYTGGFGFTLGHAALDARPFSFSAERAPRPDYTDTQFAASLGGPFRIPGVRNRPVFFAGYQHSSDHNASAQSAIMPTMEQRAGDFSGGPEIRDPFTGDPFPGNVIPASRISPQASALLALYPAPNADAGGYNFERTTVSLTNQDTFQSRVNHAISGRDSLLGTANYQRSSTDAGNVFGFVDSAGTSALDTAVTWSHRFNQFLTLRLGYQFVRQTIDSTPHFANRVNVSGLAGIAGNNQEAVNWGPPALIFSSGIAGLGPGQYLRQNSRVHAFTPEVLWRTRGGHNLAFGGSVRPQEVDVLGQQDARGSFSFNGSATGSDLADFLLGSPHSAAIAFGNADKLLLGESLNAYVTDDWRINPTLTVNLGLRWEYEAPYREKLNRLVNLDVAPGFTTATPVVGAELEPDPRGVQPRLALALRPIAGSSLVIRAGWGIYRNTSVYQSIALMLAQQPPLSKVLSIESIVRTPADAGEWVQRAGQSCFKQLCRRSGLPCQLCAQLAGLRSARSAGVADRHRDVSRNKGQPSHAGVRAEYISGRRRKSVRGVSERYVYLASNGSSLKNAAQLQVRRRLRQGLMAVASYTFAKATDNAAAFTTADLSGGVIAQNWLDLDAERAPSSFDQRHLLTAQVEYAGSALSSQLAVHEPAHRRQRSPLDAAVPDVACRHRHYRDASRKLHRRFRAAPRRPATM